MEIKDIKNMFFSLKDEKYGDFNHKLTPNIPREKFIGVRTGEIRKIAKKIRKNNPKLINEFVKALPHEYIEEYLLHIYLINDEKDLKVVVKHIDDLLPYIDNWMTCDAIRPKVFKKHLDEAGTFIFGCIKSEATYTKRFGIEMLMSYYLDDAFLSIA